MEHLQAWKMEFPSQHMGKSLVQTPQQVCKTLRAALVFAPCLESPKDAGRAGSMPLLVQA